MRPTVCIMLSLLHLAAFAGRTAADDQIARAVDEALLAGMPAETPQQPGWIIAVIREGRLVYQRAHGMADVETQTPITAQTAFDLSTLSRHFTAAAIAMLIENGAIRLEDDIRTFIPKMPRRTPPITLEHLIYHTSGIPDYAALMKKAGLKTADDLKIVDLLAEAPLDFEPGTRSTYHAHESGRSNYFLLGFIVKRVTSGSLAEHSDRVLFGPLGIEAVFADHPEKQVQNKAAGYRTTPEEPRFARVEDPNPHVVGDRGLYMSIDQLVLWEKALYEQKIGGPRFRSLITRTGPRLPNGPTVNYAFGLIESHDDDKQPVWCVQGTSPGFTISYERHPAKNLTIIALSNVENADLTHLTGSVGAYFLKGIRRVPDAVADGGWIRLFDGRTFEGWEGNRDMFRIEDGKIVGGSLKHSIPRNEFLCTEKEYADFILQLKVKLLGDPAHANAGIQIRSRRIPNHHEMIGYQADMGQHYWGCLYDESRRNRVLAQADRAELDKVLKPGQWNDYMIRCEGRRIQLWINGFQTVDYTEPDDNIEQKGIIGLQIHSGPPSEAWYKDILIRPIP